MGKASGGISRVADTSGNWDREEEKGKNNAALVTTS